MVWVGLAINLYSCGGLASIIHCNKVVGIRCTGVLSIGYGNELVGYIYI